MFRSKSPTIELLLKNETYLNLINKINMDLFKGKVGIFIDYANIVGSQDDLKWHIDVPRLKYFFHCFDQVKKINLYYGTQKNDPKSEKFIHEMMEMDINVTTKFVKKITNSIDVLNIKKDSPTVLKRFIKNSLLQKLDIETIKFLNHKLKRINLSGIKYVYDRKCNFDVE
ncbi:MAG: hypothetical protein Q7R95_05335, partial [bacterium]|nr:hypothetical protein [bacterium]